MQVAGWLLAIHENAAPAINVTLQAKYSQYLCRLIIIPINSLCQLVLKRYETAHHLLKSESAVSELPSGSWPMTLRALYKRVNNSWRVISLSGAYRLLSTPADIPRRLAIAR